MTKTSNKLVLLNKLALFNEDNELIQENIQIVDLFYQEDIRIGILARRNTLRELSKHIPEEYKDKILLVNRGSKTREKIKELKSEGIAFSIVGIVDYDAIFSFNCKIPLFHLESLNTMKIDVGEKVVKYGLLVKTYQDIIDCLKAQEIHRKNYFELNNINDNYTAISLNNANTHYRPEKEIRIKQIFESNLKGNEFTRDQKTLQLLFFNLLSEISQNSYFEQVKYWGTFPSSNPNNTNTSISYIKEAVRVLMDGMPQNEKEILIRYKEMCPKNRSGLSRLEYKCNKDFETLMVNPELKGKLDNEVVCIIDDYMTNGYSAESAKHILFAAGAKKVIFITLGKFGRRYYSTNYSIKGDVFTKSYEYEFKSEKLITNMSNYNTDNDYQILGFDGLV